MIVVVMWSCKVLGLWSSDEDSHTIWLDFCLVALADSA